MITTEEIGLIDRKYFEVLQAGGFDICLQSKNTKHYWYIVEDVFPHFRHFKIYHKHNYGDAYHRHKDKPTLDEVIVEIMSHDAYQLNDRQH
ncbi:MAG: hypothetical protein NC125_12925 [Muribaculaceae bacterium]|nr:hypothetical protein [Muribaculaceae bacterium]